MKGLLLKKNVHYTMTVVNSQMNKVRMTLHTFIRLWWQQINDHWFMIIHQGLGTMNLNANYTFDLETWNIKFKVKVTDKGPEGNNSWRSIDLHLMCERVIDHGLGTEKLNANYTFDLETWNIRGQDNRQRSRWKQLMKVY